ncbi:uncharacterized protein LOC123013343 isoform X2 [Tribolium madens]|uniref:uncharacterized protein LOC123013343 isoform X2 n=1 Tax=Tribolium madens TaxID=41895 RepID=UPI001CF7221A|nr:uncharacterized protein LOC123013343 isoform X2 [Tribolium madens]
MKYKILTIIITFITSECLSQSTSPCQSQFENTTEIDWAVGLIKHTQNDNEIVNVSFAYNGSLTTEAGDPNEFSARYIDIVTDNNQLIFRSNENWTKLEEDLDIRSKIQGNQITFSRQVKLICDNNETKTLQFIIYVIDTNNHDPTFDKQSYSYKMPMPLIPNIDLTGFGDDIIVTDYDFTNKNVTFSIDDKDFEVTTKHNPDSNTYQAVLKVKNYKYLSSDTTTLSLNSTDSGEPSRSQTSQIQIKIDESNSLPDIPTVPEASYQFQYSIENNKPVLKPLHTNQDIKVTASDPTKIKVKLEGNDHFSAEFNEAKQTVTIKTTEEVIENTPNPVLVLTLVVTLNGKEEDSSKTAILVNLPKDKIITIPQFDKPYYKAQYKVNAEDKDTVELESDITVSEDAEVALEGDETHFNISKSDDNKWQVTVISDLDSGDFKEKDIPLTLHATVKDAKGTTYDGYATLLVTLPEVEEAPRFTKPYYTATYKVNDGDTLDQLTVDGDIALILPSDDVKVELVDNQEYFNLICDPTSGKCAIEVKVDLGHDILEKGGDLIVNFKATLNGVEEPSALVITLPEVVEVKFMNSNYVSTYNITGEKATVDITEFPITITPTDKNITVSFNEVNNNFEIVASDSSKGQYTINVKQPLNDIDLVKREPKVLTLQANIPGWRNKATSTLIIKLPDVSPKFNKPYYEAIYKVDNKGVANVTLSEKITLTSTVNSKISLIGSYVDNFSFDVDKNPQITVKKNLDEKIVNANQQILLTLQVTPGGSEDQETTIIALKLPYDGTTKTLKFEQPAYVFSYKTDKADPYIDNGGQSISLVSAESNVNINITGTYSENFEIKSENNKISLNIKKPLDQTVLDTQPDILFVLDANLDKFEDGFTTVLLHLPAKNSTSELKFVEPVFTAIYELGKEENNRTANVTIVGNGISLEGGTTEATIELTGTNSEHFDVSKNSTGTGYDLTLVSNLDDSILITEADVVLTLKATLGDQVGEATLVVKLPKKTAPASFKKPYYEAEYKMETDPHTIDIDPIELEGDYLDDTKVTLQVDDDELKDNFEINTASPYIISLKNNLDDAILKTKHEVVLTLVATLDEISTTTSSVIVKIPDLPTPPNFKKIVYKGKYDSDNNIVKLDDNIETDAKDPAVVKITVEDPYASNFTVVYDDKNKEFTVNVIDSLDNATVTNNDEIYVVFDATVDRAVTHTSATLVLKMPTTLTQIVPTFSETYYKAHYSLDDTVTITKPITITSDKASETQVKVIGDFSNNFETKFEDNSWQLNVKNKLEDSYKDEIIVTLEASLEGNEITTTTTLIMDLPDRGLKASPKFTKPLYENEYVSDETPTVNITDPITLKDGFEDANVNVDAAYQKYFKLTQNKNNRNQWDISLDNPLSEEILKNNTELVVTLTANLENSEGPEYATLVVKLPSQSVETITFDKTYYSAIYTVVDGGNDTVNSSEIIVSDDGATVTVIEGYAKNFNVNCKDRKCVLTVKENLHDADLKTKNEVIVVLQATKSGDIADKATAPVIVSLPLQDSIEAPKFEKPVYTVDYDKETNKISDNSIKFEGADTKDITVAIDPSSAYKDNFKVTLKTDHWEVEVDKKLDVSKKASISFILQATKKDVKTPGEAVFIVNLPKNEDTSDLEFSQVTYTGTYNVKDDIDEVVLEQNIEIKGISDTNQADFSVEPGDYIDNFEVNADTDHWIISVKKDLKSDILDSETSIILTLKATVAETSSTGEVGVVINLPKKYTPTSFYFEKTSYTAEYEIENDKPKLNVDSDIIIKNLSDSVGVKLTGDYSKYFDSSYSEDKVTITLSSTALNSDVVEKESAISVTIEATNDNKEVARAVLVVKLPKETSKNDSDDQTGLIAAVAVLAVLLVASLVGSAVFYYFKFKTAKNYSNMSDSPRPSERFRKNSTGLDTRGQYAY